MKFPKNDMKVNLHTSTGISVSLFLSTLKFVIFFNFPIVFGNS